MTENESTETWMRTGSANEMARELTIGSVRLKNTYILGPMAGVTDLPFRLLCAQQGAGMVCMEMVSAKAISYGNKKTIELMRTVPEEGPVCLQLFGSQPELMAQVAARIEPQPFDILDINMGCPVPKVVKNGEGSALLLNPPLAEQIIRQVSRAVKKPVTAKIRIGFDESHINCVEMAKRLENAGAAAIAVHGRTREQYYSGKADWEQIARVKETVQIPVIGNGDVRCPQDAKRMREMTGCDGIMIARAARGNPWIFRDMLSFEETGKQGPDPLPDEIAVMVKRHARMLADLKGEETAIREMRKHAGWYTTGGRNASHLRRKINEAATLAELENLIDGWAQESV